MAMARSSGNAFSVVAGAADGVGVGWRAVPAVIIVAIVIAAATLHAVRATLDLLSFPLHFAPDSSQ
jgi:uncharacterized membrane protein YvlD (DUF360 family)